MKKIVLGFILGMVTTIIFTSAYSVFAGTSYERNILAAFNGIKIYVDDMLITPKDGKGQTVEPFIINGTTYLPVRAVSEALNKKVEWEDTTKSIFIGNHDKPAIKLFETLLGNSLRPTLPVLTFNEFAGKFSNLFDWDSEKDISVNGEKYLYGRKFLLTRPQWGISETDWVSIFDVTFITNRQYKYFKGNLVIPKHDFTECKGGVSKLIIYGDGDNILYTSPEIKDEEGQESVNFKIDISNVNYLRYEIQLYGEKAYLGIVNAGVYYD